MANIKGLSGLLAKMRRLEADTQKAAQKGILKTAKAIEATAKAKAPVNTAELQKSIGTEVKENTTYVFASARHAPYIEFGTGTRVDIPKGYEEYALEFFVDGSGHTGPKPFLFPAFFQHQGELLPNVDEEIKKTLDKW